MCFEGIRVVWEECYETLLTRVGSETRINYPIVPFLYI